MLQKTTMQIENKNVLNLWKILHLDDYGNFGILNQSAFSYETVDLQIV